MNATRRNGFTLIELLVSISLTMFISAMVYQMYKTCLNTYSISRSQLMELKSFRAATDRLNTDLGGIVWKSTYINDSRHDVKPPLKPIHMGLLSVRMEGKTLGFYATLSPGKVSRAIYYFNPGEAPYDPGDGSGFAGDGFDSDGDDEVDTRLGLMVDDTGSLMLEFKPDEHIAWDYEHAAFYVGVVPSDKMAYYLQDGCGPDGYNKQWDPKRQWDHKNDCWNDTFGAGTCNYDPGDKLCENLRDINFRYAYVNKDAGGTPDTRFSFATTWPYKDIDNDGFYDSDAHDPASWITDGTGLKYGDTGALMKNSFIDAPGGDWDQTKGMSFLTIPQAISVDFHFVQGANSNRMSRMFYLPSSRWNEYLDRARN